MNKNASPKICWITVTNGSCSYFHVTSVRIFFPILPISSTAFLYHVVIHGDGKSNVCFDRVRSRKYKYLFSNGVKVKKAKVQTHPWKLDGTVTTYLYFFASQHRVQVGLLLCVECAVTCTALTPLRLPTRDSLSMSIKPLLSENNLGGEAVIIYDESKLSHQRWFVLCHATWMKWLLKKNKIPTWLSDRSLYNGHNISMRPIKLGHWCS